MKIWSKEGKHIGHFVGDVYYFFKKEDNAKHPSGIKIQADKPLIRKKKVKEDGNINAKSI